MSLSRSDLKRLRLPVAVALVLAAAGAACVVAANHYAVQARADHQAAKARRAEAQKRVDQAAEEEREIRQNLVHYEEMARRGMTDPENRLDIIDTITRIKNERKLFEIRYNIEPQKALDYPGVVAASPLNLAVSRLKLDMLLLHEEDLIGFLSDLDRSVSAHVNVRHCAMARLETGGAPALAVIPRVRAECEVDLIVVREAGPA